MPWKTIGLCAASFIFGRLSYLIYRNSYLESKKQELIDFHIALQKHGEALDEVAQDLRKKDKELRLKWQAMVSDISNYVAIVDDDDSNKWTDSDDMFLASWKSAEEEL